MSRSLRRVLVTEPIHHVGLELLARHAEVVNLVYQSGQTLDDLLPTVDGVIVRIARITAERLARAPRLRVIGKHGVGVDNIDLTAAKARGVVVVSTPGTNDEAVAEFTIMCLLMLARRVQAATRLVRDGAFDRARQVLRPIELRGRTLGLIGLGRIGARVAQIGATAFGLRVLGVDPFVTAERARQLGVELRPDIATLLPECDFVSLHVPLTPGTRGLIGRAELASMKPGSFLVNCARGGLVDEAALVEALESGHLAGAAIDVFAEEPPARDHPLLRFENVIPTPHVAGQTEESLRRMATMVAEDVLGVLRGEPPRHPVR